ncbi:MAG: hypothetical protein QG592_443 [Pseudomonadota bacterium]|jgi:hypothetical protein|nr:hypothetical protein [Pseudomonadota bacterium]MDQ5904764.1 hypothetical protein [Pseudomonadota bacterium]MDQ5906274.1 hypothetical protein [Pseudomonadota bacterium]MDQ5915979.1 hypothetical protein [Pseudomonadota bacterium]MDQ5917189.1 hypothetical protein [Pseudomonadota bacterium]
MNVVYNSEHYSILAYPAQESFELVDKEASRTLFIRGEVAFRFRQAIDSIPEGERDEETIDDFIESYCEGAASPIRFH